MKTAVVVGSSGQDGRILCDQLRLSGARVTGVTRSSLDILDPAAVKVLIKNEKPDEIYYLAAHHHSAEDASDDQAGQVRRFHEVNSLGLEYFLEGVRLYQPKARIFYAGSSHVFGHPSVTPQNENTPFSPETPYAVSKAAGVELCRKYRSQEGLFAVAGILYNHESPLRAERFISKKISRAAVEISRGKRERLILGSLNARVDWGYAPDYMKAAQMTLGASHPSDYIISSGVAHSVQEMVETAFKHLGLDWKNHVTQDPAVLGRSGAELVGDCSRLRALGWLPSLSFDQMVRHLVDFEKNLPSQTD